MNLNDALRSQHKEVLVPDSKKQDPSQKNKHDEPKGLLINLKNREDKSDAKTDKDKRIKTG